MGKKPFVHPYIPNSVPETKRSMMKAVNIGALEELYTEIPDHLRFRGKMNLPEPILSEYELKKHVTEILNKNTTCDDYLSFLGAGCWQHYVPAVVDEILGRAELLTAYCGAEYCDLGKWQARYESYSLLAELLNFDVVAESSYDWATAAGFAIRMASRITGRNEVLLPATTAPERLQVIETLCQPEPMRGFVEIKQVAYNPVSGLMDFEDLQTKISNKTAAVYFENPSYLGFVEHQAEKICHIARSRGALSIVGVDPVSLGIIVPPADYGADIACGELQPLGIHMYCGGGMAGFIAFRDDDLYISECPMSIFSLVPTATGQFAFAEIQPERTSYGARDKAKDWTGTASGLWTIAAGVYLALMGPRGMKEIGETIIQNANYARNIIAEIKGIKILFDNTFKEFVVNFDAAGKTVAQVNEALEARQIFGGKDISGEFPDLGNSALYCVTEMQAKKDIDRLQTALREVLHP